MPTYEYACTSCGHRLEANQAYTDDPLTTCPECGAQLRKVFGNIGIVLKGSGFYRTDSRSSSSSSRTAAKDGGSSNGAGDSNGSSGASSNGSGSSNGSSTSSDSSGSSSSASTTTSGAATGAN